MALAQPGVIGVSIGLPLDANRLANGQLVGRQIRSGPEIRLTASGSNSFIIIFFPVARRFLVLASHLLYMQRRSCRQNHLHVDQIRR
jgi:hypothetical protein